MRDYELKGKKIVQLEVGRELVLEYYLVNERRNGHENPFYGIEIRKMDSNIVEKEMIEGISYSKEVVTDLLELMVKHTVTPVCMAEIADDYITERICS